MYYFVERSVVVVKPKKPFLDWVINNFDDVEDKLTLDIMRVDCNSYLIPEINEIEDGIKYIDDKFEDIFKMELASWTIDEVLWPKDISLKMFWDWFDIEISGSLIDLTDEDEATEDNKNVDTIH